MPCPFSIVILILCKLLTGNNARLWKGTRAIYLKFAIHHLYHSFSCAGATLTTNFMVDHCGVGLYEHNWRGKSTSLKNPSLNRTKDKIINNHLPMIEDHTRQFHHQYHFMVMVNIYKCGRKLAWGTICNWREKNSIFNFHLLVI